MYYGSIAQMDVKEGHQDDLVKLFEDTRDTPPEGMVAWLLMQPDEEDYMLGVAVFESKDAYVANANRPEQHESFLQIMEHLDSEPTWTDGTYLLQQIL
jgi:hypothetical protein